MIYSVNQNHKDRVKKIHYSVITLKRYINQTKKSSTNYRVNSMIRWSNYTKRIRYELKCKIHKQDRVINLKLHADLHCNFTLKIVNNTKITL